MQKFTGLISCIAKNINILCFQVTQNPKNPFLFQVARQRHKNNVKGTSARHFELLAKTSFIMT